VREPRFIRASRAQLTAIQLLITIGLAFLVYSNALDNGFVYDDVDQVVNNFAIRDVSNFPRIFAEDVWSLTGEGRSNYYRPVMHSVYMLSHVVFGLDPWGFHLVNVMLHAAASALVFLIIRMLLERAELGSPDLSALLATVLFVTHPIHTEAVTWIAGLPEVSFSLFFLLSLYLYMRATPEGHVSSGRLYALSLISFLLSTLSKETAFALIPVLAAYDYCLVRRPFRPDRVARVYGPFLAVGGFYLIVRTAVLSSFAPLQRHAELGAYGYFINVFPLFSGYLEKLLVPMDLNAFYVFHPISSVGAVAGIASLGVALGFAVALYVSMRRVRIVFLGLALIAIPLLPVLYIPALGENTFAERYLYLPSVGFAIVVASLFSWMIRRVPRGREVALGLCLVVTALFSVATLQRNPVWKDELTLWTDTVGKSPDGALPRLQFGIAHAENGDLEGALEQYRIALEIEPEYSAAYSNIGLVYSDTGRPDRAVEYFQKALQLKPTSFAARNNLGVAYSQMGLSGNAIDQFKESLALQPLQPGVHNNLGNEYRGMRRFDQALAEYRKALALQPDNAEAYNNIGVAYGQMGHADDAVANLLTALRINPDNPSFHHNLSNAYRMKGLEREAATHSARARELAGGQRGAPAR
jgi:tetratricopeptide (TPR) repeat protein